jgi:hypothetical protein
MNRNALHRTITLPLAAILLALTLNAAAAQDSPPSDPIPTSTGAAALRPDDAAPLRPDDAAPLRPDDAAPLRPDAAAPLRPDDAAPLRPDDAAPPADAITGATAGSFAVYLPLVVRPNPIFDMYPPVNRQWELEFIRLLNEERARHGLHPLREHPLLTLAARRHAYDLGINKVPRGDCGGGRGHTGTDGTEPWHRVWQTGYPGRFEGEAVSCGKHEVYYAVQGLLESPPHRAFLLSPIPVEIGVGVHPIITDVDWMQGAHSTVMLGGTSNP